MGVTTTADERLRDAAEHIESAIKNLNEVVVVGCWGSDSYNEEYTQNIEKAFFKLLKIKKLINR